MSKKINPTSLRIGTQLNWNQTFQNYNQKKSFKNIWLFTKTIPVITLLKISPFILLNKIKTEISTTNSNFSIFIHTSKPKQLTLFSQVVPVLRHTSLSKYYTYNSACFLISAKLVACYALFLFNNKVPLRKIIVLLTNLLLPNLKTKTRLIKSTKFGVQIFSLKGFQFSVSGRFELSSTQMSKTLKQTVGTLPIVSLENYIEFACIPFYFKLGKCNFKIWLFYTPV